MLLEPDRFGADSTCPGAGPPVVGLLYGVESGLNRCVPANPGRLSDILSNPSPYHERIATTEFPDGALRSDIASLIYFLLRRSIA